MIAALFQLQSLLFSAEMPETLAVLPIQPCEGVGKEIAAAITDVIEHALKSTGKFTLVNRADMEAILREQDFQHSGRCDEPGCAVTIGRILGTKKMVTGRMAQVGRLYQVRLQLIEVETAVIENEILDKCQCGPEALLRLAEAEAYLLAGTDSEPRSVVDVMTRDAVSNVAPGIMLAARGVHATVKKDSVILNFRYIIQDCSNPTAIVQLLVAVGKSGLVCIYHGMPGCSGASQVVTIAIPLRHYGSEGDGKTAIYFAGIWTTSVARAKRDFLTGGGHRDIIGVINYHKVQG